MFDQNTLNMFIALYECGSMHKASERLFISQQGISKNIRALEKTLDAELFVRSSAGVEPTQAGQLFYREALKLRNQYDHLYQQIRNASAGKKTVSLACAYGSLYHIFPLLKQFEKENPDITVHWQELTDRETEKKLITEQADLSVNVYGMQAGYVSFTPLYSCPVCLIVYEGHSLYDREQIAFRDLDQERIILEGPDFQIYHDFRTNCDRTGVHPRIIAETSDIGFCQHMAEIGEGLAVTLEFVARERKLDNVRVIPFDSSEFFWEIGLERLRGKSLTPEAARLEKFLLRRN